MEIRQVYEFIKDLWKLIKATYVQPDPSSAESDAYWKNLVDRGAKLAKDYGDDDLVKRMVLAYLDYQDVKQMEKSNEGTTD